MAGHPHHLRKMESNETLSRGLAEQELELFRTMDGEAEKAVEMW